MNNRFWNSDKILSLTAIFLSICTLVVFVYQTQLIREQQYKSVFPYLEMGNAGTNTTGYGFYLVNTGIGPAMIKKVEIKYADSSFQMDLATHLNLNIKDKDSIEFTHSNISIGQLIPPERVINLAKLSKPDIKMGRRLHKFIHDPKLDFIIEYESIYNERWRLSYRNGLPEKLN